jgi:hypothetical protein
VVDEKFQFVTLQQAGKRHSHSPRLENPEVEGNPITGIGCTKPDVVARFNTHSDECCGHAIGSIVKLSIAGLGHVFAQYGPVRKVECGSFQIFCNIHYVSFLYINDGIKSAIPGKIEKSKEL